MSASFPTQGHYVVYMYPDVIFQILLLCSRPMMSHASSLLLKEKEKEKEIQKKRNIKSRKIDKRKRKMLVSKAFHNTYIGLTQENSIENSVQDYLSYIPRLMVYAILQLAYSNCLP